MKRILFSALLGALASTASAKQLCEGFFPKNHKWVGIEVSGQGIDQGAFDQVLNKLTELYTPVAMAKNAKLAFDREWEDGTVNSFTGIEDGTWVIYSFGGLARYQGMTADAFAAVGCHELGHHLGGAPLFSNDPRGAWASVEGEADYFSTAKCLHKYFAGDDNQAIVSGMQLDPFVVAKCTANYPDNPEDQYVCMRTAAAGTVLGNVLGDVMGTGHVSATTPDPSVVEVTYEGHPAAQCRMDTLLRGALCTVSPDVEFSMNDDHVGACVTEADGKRPLCWYKPD